MPINKEYCDAWYEACKDDYFCYDAANNATSWFSHPTLHQKGECTAASGNCKTYADVFGAIPRWPAAATSSYWKGSCWTCLLLGSV